MKNASVGATPDASERGPAKSKNSEVQRRRYYPPSNRVSINRKKSRRSIANSATTQNIRRIEN